MRYALVSDVHSNERAWSAVLLDIRSSGVDRIICLGDMIGYGPKPREVLESLYANVDHFLLGNHDAALCGKISADLFTDPAREIIGWTNGQLADSARRFMMRLPLTIAGPGFRCAHANFSRPAAFSYIFEPEDALPDWSAVPEPLLFIGHTQRPAIFILGQSGTPRRIPPEDFMLEPGKRFLLNIGSVGQPRDDDARASYCIFDGDTGSIFWRKIPFDLDAHRSDLQKAGLPEVAAPFLNVDPRNRRQPLRELVNFSPPTRPEEAVQDAVSVQHLDVLQRRVSRWRMMFAALLAMILFAGAVLGMQWWRYKNRRMILSGEVMDVVRAGDHAPGSNLVDLPMTAVEPGEAFPNWDLAVGNRYRQQAVWQSTGTGGYFELLSGDSRSECWLISPSVHIGRERVMMQGFFLKSDDFKGSAALVLELTQQTGTDSLRPEFEVMHNFQVKEPTMRRADNWFEARSTFDLPARTHAVRLKIGGKFTGTVQVRDVRLERRP